MAEQSAASKENLRIGFIGIGNMGSPMAANLKKAGWNVTVYDTAPDRIISFIQAHGGTAASGLTELGRNSIRASRWVS